MNMCHRCNSSSADTLRRRLCAQRCGKLTRRWDDERREVKEEGGLQAHAVLEREQRKFLCDDDIQLVRIHCAQLVTRIAQSAIEGLQQHLH